MNQKTSKVEKEFYLRCSYLTLSVLFDKEPKKEGRREINFNYLLTAFSTFPSIDHLFFVVIFIFGFLSTYQVQS